MNKPTPTAEQTLAVQIWAEYAEAERAEMDNAWKTGRVAPADRERTSAVRAKFMALSEAAQNYAIHA